MKKSQGRTDNVIFTSPSGEAFQVSPRERDILRSLYEGLSDRQIADLLFLSVWTVRVHLSHLRKKFEVHNRTQLVIAAERNGLLEHEESDKYIENGSGDVQHRPATGKKNRGGGPLQPDEHHKARKNN